MSGTNVLRDLEDTKAYRCAVATIIEDIEKATKEPLCLIAERIGVSLGTMSNAKNGKVSLTAIYLKRLGENYGAAFLNPYLALFGAQAAPMEKRATRDILPLALRLTQKIASARDPDGPGGTTELPQEKSAYLGDLKELHRETGNLVTEIEEVLS